jgi:hypothetical protein
MARNIEFNVVANDKATGTLKNVSKETEKFGNSVGKSTAKWAAAGVGLTAIGAAAFNAAKQMSSIKDEAARLGMGVVEFQKLKFAAEQSGLSIEQLGKGYKDLRNLVRDAGNLAEAGKTNDPKVKALQALGFSMDEIKTKGISADEILQRMAVSMSSLTDEQQKYEMATAVFGDKIAMDMIPLLSNYDELRANMAKAPYATVEQADQLDRLGDKLDAMALEAQVTAGTTMANALGITAGAVGAAPKAAMTPGTAEALGKKTPAQMAQDLINAGKKPSEGGKMAVSSMAQIGGSAYQAAGMVAGKTATDHLAIIAQNTTTMADNTSGATDGTIPKAGATNFTNPNNDLLRTCINVFKSTFGK